MMLSIGEGRAGGAYDGLAMTYLLVYSSASVVLDAIARRRCREALKSPLVPSGYDRAIANLNPMPHLSGFPS